MKFRKAIKKDVPFIIQMLANDKLGKLREDYKNPLLVFKCSRKFQFTNSVSTRTLEHKNTINKCKSNVLFPTRYFQ